MAFNINGKRPSDEFQPDSEKRFTGNYRFGQEIWSVQWRLPQTKKHKTWENDGVVLAQNGKFLLYDSSGVIICTSKANRELDEDVEFMLGGRDVRIDQPIFHDQFADRSCFRNAQQSSKVDAAKQASPRVPHKFTPLRPSSAANHAPRKSIQLVPVPLLDYFGTSASQRGLSELSGDDGSNLPAKNTPNKTVPAAISANSFYKPKPKARPRGALHDPDAEGAIVMATPPADHEMAINKDGHPQVPVVIDPLLAHHLRPHQIEGVRFLYESTMGFRGKERNGCILADSMGLGKTLQTITLVWTFLKQYPYSNRQSTTGKILIACPVSLVQNWKMEFYKWLGRDRVGILTGDKDKNSLKHFKNPRPHQVLIIGYERLRTIIDDLKYCQPPIGLIICDEGHRLKSSASKVYKMFSPFKGTPRIILSGTPIQNDLSELHAMADFCNPGLLGSYSEFRKKYEAPILKSRAPDSTAKQREIGELRANELLSTTKTFVLRREASLLAKYLPPKVEYVLFVKPTELQMKIFADILQTDKLNAIIQRSTAHTLAYINQLTKISNSPQLAKRLDVDDSQEESEIVRTSLQEVASEETEPGDITTSGKLTLMGGILRKLYKHTEEKCVVVSHYTATLDIIEAYCNRKRYSYFRLDGQTPQQKRQEYVNKFNKESQKERFLFLLSAKAGGVGLNLIGASRLIMIDSDWNPSHDQQAMARIHRDGQKHPVFIYRLLTCGAIDEKIYQRQVTKMGLSATFIGGGLMKRDSKDKSDSFTARELRDIFTIQTGTECHTHDLLQCPCPSAIGFPVLPKESSNEENDNFDILPNDSDNDEMDVEFNNKGFVVASQLDPLEIEQDEKAQKKKAAALKALTEWTHINCLYPAAVGAVQDDVLSQIISLNIDEDEPAEAELEVDTESPESRKARMDELHDGAVTFLFEKRSESHMDEEET